MAVRKILFIKILFENDPQHRRKNIFRKICFEKYFSKKSFSKNFFEKYRPSVVRREIFSSYHLRYAVTDAGSRGQRAQAARAGRSREQGLSKDLTAFLKYWLLEIMSPEPSSVKKFFEKYCSKHIFRNICFRKIVFEQCFAKHMFRQTFVESYFRKMFFEKHFSKNIFRNICFEK